MFDSFLLGLCGQYAFEYMMIRIMVLKLSSGCILASGIRIQYKHDSNHAVKKQFLLCYLKLLGLIFCNKSVSFLKTHS